MIPNTLQFAISHIPTYIECLYANSRLESGVLITSETLLMLNYIPETISPKLPTLCGRTIF